MLPMTAFVVKSRMPGLSTSRAIVAKYLLAFTLPVHIVDQETASLGISFSGTRSASRAGSAIVFNARGAATPAVHLGR